MRNKLIYFGISFTILLFNCIGTVFADSQHEIDSIKAYNITETNNKNLANNLIAIAELYSFSNHDSAIFYANKALELSQKIKYKESEGEAHFILGYVYDQVSKTDLAIEEMEKAIEIFIEVGDSTYLVGCYNNLGVFYSYGTDQKKAVEYFIKAINLAEILDDTYSLSDGYSNIGMFYEILDEYGSALKFFKKGLDVDIQAGDAGNTALSYLDIGNINIKLFRFEQAFENLTMAQKFMPEVEDKYRQSELYLRFADYYLEMNNSDSVKAYLNRARQIGKSIVYPRLEADILVIEGDCNLKQANYKESIQLFNRAIDIYNELQVHDSFYELYLSKSTALSELGLHNQAYQTLQLANRSKALFQPNEIARLLGEFEQKEALKEERGKLLLEQELENQKNKNDIIRIRTNLQLAIFSIVLLLIVVAIILYSYFSKRKHNKVLSLNYETIDRQNKLIEENLKKLEFKENKLCELVATKDKFFSIIAHDLKNPFNVLIGLSDAFRNNPELRDTDEFEELMNGMFQAATSGYNLLENLLEWARTQTGNIENNPKILDLNEIVASGVSYFQESAKAKKIEINVEMGNYPCVFADYNMVNFIVRNLMNNAIKFSYPKGVIDVFLNRKDDFCTICIQDYGIGVNKKTLDKLFRIDKTIHSVGTSGEEGTGLGLILCKEFIKKNGGEIWVESEENKGSKFCFSLPVDKNEK